MKFERHIASLPEASLSNFPVLGHAQAPYVRAVRTEDSDGVVEYSIQGQVAMERDAINAVMRTPLNLQDNSNWFDVRDGLRDLSYPAKHIRSLARVASLTSHLDSIAVAAKQLADVLDNNQDYRARSANIPVFTYPEAHRYTTDQIIGESNERRLLLMIKSLGVNPELSKKLSRALNSNVLQAGENVRQLQEMTAFTDKELTEMQNLAIIDQIEPRVIAELIERIQSSQFSVFKRTASFDEKHLSGGTSDPDVYILDEDVPVGMKRGENVYVAVERKLRDKDKKRNRERYRVTFRSQSPRFVTVPRITWRSEDGVRRLVLSGNPWQESRGGVVVRPSSIAGAAIAACVLGQNIDYADRLDRVLGNSPFRKHKNKELPPSAAGLWPLVATYRQDALLSNPYFESVEKELQ
jgi:hypothetical protein